MHCAKTAYHWKSHGMGITTGTSILLPSTVYKGDMGRMLDVGPPKGVLCVGRKWMASSMGHTLCLQALVPRGGSEWDSDDVTMSDSDGEGDPDK